MIGRRAAFGLTMLCAFLVCAVAVQSASATGQASEETTAFTCVKVTTPKTGDFEDAHCDVRNPKQQGEYTHIVLPLKETTPITYTNANTQGKTKESTSMTLKGIVAGIAVEITCKTAHGEGVIHNEEPKPKVHNVTGNTSLDFSECEVKKPAEGCTVNTIELEADYQGVENLGTEADEMGVEFKPPGAAKSFGAIILSGAKCILAGKPIELEGSAIATGGTATPKDNWSGATQIFSPSKTAGTLKMGGNSAELSASLTLKMTPTGGKPQDPISTTTTTE